MTKTYELPNEKTIMADVDEKHHTATVSVYALEDLIEMVNKTGQWMPDNRPGGGFWVCSNCKFPSEAFAADRLYKYCPACGCRMM